MSTHMPASNAGAPRGRERQITPGPSLRWVPKSYEVFYNYVVNALSLIIVKQQLSSLRLCLANFEDESIKFFFQEPQFADDFNIMGLLRYNGPSFFTCPGPSKALGGPALMYGSLLELAHPERI